MSTQRRPGRKMDRSSAHWREHRPSEPESRRPTRRPKKPHAHALTIELPDDVSDAIDALLAKLRTEMPDVPLAREDVARRLLAQALDQQKRSTRRLRVLRYRIVNAVRFLAGGEEREVGLGALRDMLLDVPRDVLDETLLELEDDGLLALGRAAHPSAADRDAAIDHRARGRLTSVLATGDAG